MLGKELPSQIRGKVEIQFNYVWKNTVHLGVERADEKRTEFTYVVSRVRLILAIIPNEGSILAYIVDITPTTTISQLDGLAG